MLILKNFRKIYNGNLILKAESQQIPEGLIWIKGMNGSGKSTLLKSIAGIIPFDGDILLNGISLKKDPILIRRKITYAEAEPFYPEMLTAREIIEFAASVRGESNENTRELIHYFGVDTFYKQACGGYSTGMLKKVALIMAFLGDPDLILLDEPFAFIDDETEKKLTGLVRRFKDLSKTLLITSHHELPMEDVSFDWVYRIRDHHLQRD
jgi:ABC-2 type transport system ATP-binding protein